MFHDTDHCLIRKFLHVLADLITFQDRNRRFASSVCIRCYWRYNPAKIRDWGVPTNVESLSSRRTHDVIPDRSASGGEASDYSERVVIQLLGKIESVFGQV